MKKPQTQAELRRVAEEGRKQILLRLIKVVSHEEALALLMGMYSGLGHNSEEEEHPEILMKKLIVGAWADCEYVITITKLCDTIQDSNREGAEKEKAARKQKKHSSSDDETDDEAEYESPDSRKAMRRMLDGM